MLDNNAPTEAVQYAHAKVVLVGDSGVGKSGLAIVLTGQPFAPTTSTHERTVWLLNQQEVQKQDQPQEQRTVWLWDQPGQPGYRLLPSQLYLSEVTIALIVFDAASEPDPSPSIRFWHGALHHAHPTRDPSVLPPTILLVAARSDRSSRRMVNRTRIDNLLQELGCAGYIETSAKEGWGIAGLTQTIYAAIDWDRLPKVTSTRLLRDIETFVRREVQTGRLLRTRDDLFDTFLRVHHVSGARRELHQQFDTVLGQLEAQGIIRWLSFGNLILLNPMRLDSYVSCLLCEVTNESDGLGSIAESRVQQGLFYIPEADRLPDPEQEKLLLIAMIEELVRHQLILREGDFLLFPSQSTREHLDAAGLAEKLTVIFTFAGSVLLIYTTLAVRLAQCGFFQKVDFWRYGMTYTTPLGGTYGLQLARHEGRSELGIFFDEATHEETRFHFEHFVQTHLERYAGGKVLRRRQFFCPTCGCIFPERQIARRQERGFTFIHCPICDVQVSLLDGAARLSVPPPSQVEVMEQTANVQRDREAAKSTLQGKIETEDFDVFLCHHGPDKPSVKRIGEQLKERGILPWLDEWELRPGLPWQRLLEEQIRQIKTAAIFVGKEGLGPWQHQELDAFLREFVRRGCPVIPVLLADAPQKPILPLFLEGVTWVDFRVKQPDPMQRLLWGITGSREMGKGMQGDGQERSF